MTLGSLLPCVLGCLWHHPLVTKHGFQKPALQGQHSLWFATSSLAGFAGVGCRVGGLPSATSYRHYPRRQPPFTSCAVHVPMWTRCVPSSALAATPPTCVSVEHAAVIYPMMLLRGRVSSQPRESGKHGDGEGCNPCVATIGFAPRERVVHYSSADSSLSVLWPLPWVHSIAAKDKLISYQLCRFIPGYRRGKSLSKQ